MPLEEVNLLELKEDLMVIGVDAGGVLSVSLSTSITFTVKTGYGLAG